MSTEKNGKSGCATLLLCLEEYVLKAAKLLTINGFKKADIIAADEGQEKEAIQPTTMELDDELQDSFLSDIEYGDITGFADV